MDSSPLSPISSGPRSRSRELEHGLTEVTAPETQQLPSPSDRISPSELIQDDDLGGTDATGNIQVPSILGKRKPSSEDIGRRKRLLSSQSDAVEQPVAGSSRLHQPENDATGSEGLLPARQEESARDSALLGPTPNSVHYAPTGELINPGSESSHQTVTSNAHVGTTSLVPDSSCEDPIDMDALPAPSGALSPQPSRQRTSRVSSVSLAKLLNADDGKPPPQPISRGPSPSRSPPPPLSGYNCPICFSPPTYATMTPCGHVCCGDCLFTAVKTTIQRSVYHGPASSGAKCPVCRAPIPGWDGKGGGVIGLELKVVHDIDRTTKPT